MGGLTPNHINYFNLVSVLKISFIIFSRAKLEIFAEEFMRKFWRLFDRESTGDLIFKLWRLSIILWVILVICMLIERFYET